jgi:predicted homoserine dehydrogenase-like protein
VEVFRGAGIAEDKIATCEETNDVLIALEREQHVVIADSGLLASLPIDAVVEATGDPEAGARNAMNAIDDGKNVVLVTKETDCVIGPLLAHRAAERNLVCTPVDGDQPSLLIGLVAWARGLGFDVVAGGKASEYDFVADFDAMTIRRLDQVVDVPGLAGSWHLDPNHIERDLARRHARATELPRRTVPDLCELTVVANHTGLRPDRPGLHAVVARTLELPDIFRPRSEGGVLSDDGMVDMFNCLRRPDELSFAGGVFVVVRCPDVKTTALLSEKGLPVSADGRYVLLHNPVHLLGMEAPVSLLSAVRLGRSTGGTEVRPRIDVVARASRNLVAGTDLFIAHRHSIDGLDAEMMPASAIGEGRPLPYYLAVGCRLARDVASGDLLTADMVEPPAQSKLWDLRREQDALFMPDVAVEP